LVLTGGASVFLLGHLAAAQEGRRFRGQNGSGLSTATTMPTRFNENALNWKIRLPGKGHSSPVLWGKRIFLTAGDEKTGKRIVLCVDEDGKTRWTREFAGTPHR